MSAEEGKGEMVGIGSPGCTRCGGSGWDRVVDDECSCVRAASNEFDGELERPTMTLRERERREAHVRRILELGRFPQADAHARLLVSGASRGVWPTIAQIVSVSRCNLDAAHMIHDVIRGYDLSERERQRAQRAAGGIDCSRCGGSGGGPDRALKCPACRGTGIVPGSDDDPRPYEPDDFDLDDMAIMHSRAWR